MGEGEVRNGEEISFVQTLLLHRFAGQFPFISASNIARTCTTGWISRPVKSPYHVIIQESYTYEDIYAQYIKKKGKKLDL